MKKPRTYYWLRLGDGDDYCRYAEFEQVCGDMAESGVLGNLSRCVQPFGLINDQFQGNNYISCFVGDHAASPTRTLTDRELRELNAFLLAARMSRKPVDVNTTIGPCIKNTAALVKVDLKPLSTNEARAKAEQAKVARFGLMVPLWADDIYLSVNGCNKNQRQVTFNGKTHAEHEIWGDNRDNRWRKLI